MLNNLPSPKIKDKKKQVGRGIGSGKGGHTTGRGMNGQRSRSGYRKPGPAFEGGQNPISRRLPKLKGDPKKGKSVKRVFFTSRVRNTPVKLSDIAEKVKANDVVNFEKLVELQFVKSLSHKTATVKVLFDKEITKAFIIEGLPISKTAKAALEKAGGKVQ